MKRLNYLIFLFLISTFGIYSENILYTNASPSLVLREEPSVKSKKIINIPKSERVALLEESTIEEKINGLQGKWVRIKWNSYSGWVFDAFLVNEIESLDNAIKALIIKKIDQNGEFTIDAKSYAEGNIAKLLFKSPDDIVASHDSKNVNIKIIKIDYRSESLYLLIHYIETLYSPTGIISPLIVKDNRFECILPKKSITEYFSMNYILGMECFKK